jgi:hypothetical protein
MRIARICLVVVGAVAASMWTVPARAGGLTIIGHVSNGGYQFTNFDGPTPNGAGTTINGIANTGTIVGFTSPDGTTFNNFTANPLVSTSVTMLNVNNSTTAMANGINSAGTVVGSDGNGNAFTLSGGSVATYIPGGGTSAAAFGINDAGIIVGQYATAAGKTPGYVLNGTTLTTINAPSRPNTVNAQGINGNGLIVGFYMGTDGQDHGFMSHYNPGSPPSTLTGTAIADPTIPTNVPGEPGATFVFSQVLGVNDQGIAVGYYGDSTLSQHGFIYNTHTGVYSFLDDPSEGFHNGVEVTQITGINNAGEITGFYTDANGLAHGFVSLSSVPEPGSPVLMGIGLAAVVGLARRNRTRRPLAG